MVPPALIDKLADKRDAKFNCLFSEMSQLNHKFLGEFANGLFVVAMVSRC